MDSQFLIECKKWFIKIGKSSKEYLDYMNRELVDTGSQITH